MNSITVLILSSNTIVRLGLMSMIEQLDGIDVYGGSCWNEQYCSGGFADIICIYIGNSEVGKYIHQIHELREKYTSSKIIVLTSKERARIDLYTAYGTINGVLPIDISRELLETYLTDIMKYGFVLPHVENHGQNKEPCSLLDQLSVRERQILCSVSTGKTNKQIAQELYISIDTVRTHMKNIYGKLSVRGRGCLVATALTLGITGESK